MSSGSAPAKSILVVDDEPGVRELLTSYLEMVGYRPLQAADGTQALRCVEDEPVDLIITDMDMPGLTGDELLGEVKKRSPQLPVVILTGKPQVDAAVDCMRIGALDYLTKPCDLQRLGKLLEETLDEDPTKTVVMQQQQREVGGYKVLRTIGEGNMGIVFLVGGEDGKQYALKMLKNIDTVESKKRELVERFMREAEVMSKIDHPNIVRVVEYGVARDEEIPYIVMEYLKGTSMKEFGELQRRLDYRERTQIIRQIASALGALHKRDICHRDIKPTNIMIDKQLHAKLMDFGVVRVPDSQLTMKDQLLGSPAYMSPEGFRAERIDIRADVFSLGVVAYEFLLNRLPFVATSIPDVAVQICNERPLEPRKIDPNFPERLQEILAMMLKKEPSARYASAVEVMHDLDIWLEQPGTSDTKSFWQSRLSVIGRSVFQTDWQ